MKVVQLLVKIYFQQEQVLGELYWYTHQEPIPSDANIVSETLQYLQACHNLFEEGFLSHERIINLESPVLKNITKGYEYFTSWLLTLLSEGMYVHSFHAT